MDDALTAELHAALLARGYVLRDAGEHPEAFGSWWRHYERSGHAVRLVWDGRDAWFVLQAAPGWRDLATARPAELGARGLDWFLASLGRP